MSRMNLWALRHKCLFSSSCFRRPPCSELAWFLWLDATSLITALPSQLPFQSFGNASLVLWSHGGASAEGPLLPDGVTAPSPSSRLHVLILIDTAVRPEPECNDMPFNKRIRHTSTEAYRRLYVAIAAAIMQCSLST